jgi:hypothetical protein
MTNSSSKPLQTLGKWYQPRNPKKNPKPAQKKILKLFHTHKKYAVQQQRGNIYFAPQNTGRMNTSTLAHGARQDPTTQEHCLPTANPPDCM